MTYREPRGYRTKPRGMSLTMGHSEGYSTEQPRFSVPEWMRQAACIGEMDLFAADAREGNHNRKKEAEAKAICARCPVIDKCLEHTVALEAAPNPFSWAPTGCWGTAGGLTAAERKPIVAKIVKEKEAEDEQV